jgi:hypothetical protein
MAVMIVIIAVVCPADVPAPVKLSESPPCRRRPYPTQSAKDKYDRLLRYVQLPDATDLGSRMISESNAYECTYEVS